VEIEGRGPHGMAGLELLEDMPSCVQLRGMRAGACLRPFDL
jgi:hypothetical protein